MKIFAGWGSHLPVLIHLMNHTTGDVLELGTGLYSTPYLHHACLLHGGAQHLGGRGAHAQGDGDPIEVGPLLGLQ